MWRVWGYGGVGGVPKLTTQAEDIEILMGSQDHQIWAKDDPGGFFKVVVHLNGTVARATVGNHSCLVVTLATTPNATFRHS